MFNLWANDESEAFVYATTHSLQKSLSAQGCFAIGKNERWVLRMPPAAKRRPVWNRIPDDIRQRIVTMAFEQPEGSNAIKALLTELPSGTEQESRLTVLLVFSQHDSALVRSGFAICGAFGAGALHCRQ